MFFNKELEGYAGGKGKIRSGDYHEYDKFRAYDNIKDNIVENFIHKLEKLMSRSWKRIPVSIKQNITIAKNSDLTLLSLPKEVNKNVKVGFYTKVYQ